MKKAANSIPSFTEAPAGGGSAGYKRFFGNTITVDSLSSAVWTYVGGRAMLAENKPYC
jgi:hypothetical protein